MEGCGCSLDFAFGFNNANFSDRTLMIELIPESTFPKPDPVQDSANGHEAVQGNISPPGTDYSSTEMKTIHINTLILAAKSPFFYKLFSNGMAESNQRHVTLPIQESEEVAFMDLLKFIYTNTLSRTSPSALVDVLVTADKYEVALCMKYCFQLLSKLPMTCESALLYLDLPSTILMNDTVRPLTDAAKEFLIAHFKEISKFQEEMLNLTLAGIEAVLSSDDLQVSSEDEIYDFVMKWAQRHYTKPAERQDLLITRLLRLIRFPFMSRDKLEEVLTCNDINLEYRSKLVFNAISLETPHRELPPVKEQERAYILRPVKVVRFDSPPEECVVYLDLKREECASLLPIGKIRSRPFDLGGQVFYLIGGHSINQFSVHFGLYLGLRENVSVVRLVVEYEFSFRTKPSEEFVAKKKAEYTFTRGCEIGYRDGASWSKFIAEDSPYFINGVLRIRVALKIKEIIVK